MFVVATVEFNNSTDLSTYTTQAVGNTPHIWHFDIDAEGHISAMIVPDGECPPLREGTVMQIRGEGIWMPDGNLLRVVARYVQIFDQTM